jgi:hypothetical protein
MKIFKIFAGILSEYSINWKKSLLERIFPANNTFPIMNVTVKNFNETFPKVKEAIDKADFLAFDLELTGLHWDKEAQPNVMDDISIRYQKVRETANNFAIIQFGLCCFSRGAIRDT